VSARTIRRVEALEAKTPTGYDWRPLKLIADRGEPDVPARIAAAHEAGYSVIRLIGVVPPARPGIDAKPLSSMRLLQ
jgi:hypothetical protein